MPTDIKTNPIEFFLWKEDKKNENTLVYYDQEGSYHEANIGTGEITQALAVFRGRNRAIQRSSGGLTTAEPFQLILVTKPDGKAVLHVKVRFRDLKPSTAHQTTTAEYVTHTKVISPEALKEPFDFTLSDQKEQRFLVDFGKGIVPVHVFDYSTDEEGNLFAHFIELGDLERAMGARQGSRIAVQPYVVSRDVLRCAQSDPNAETSRQWVIAKEKYDGLRAKGHKVIPLCLRSGATELVPGGVAASDVRFYLKTTYLSKTSFKRTTETITYTTDDSEEGLIPFGALENRHSLVFVAFRDKNYPEAQAEGS